MLLGAFAVGISRNLAMGIETDCHCFGQLHSSPASWRTLVRNLLLAGLAGFIVIAGWSDPGTSALAWVDDLSAAAAGAIGGGLVLAAFLGFQAWFSIQLLQQNGRFLARLEAIEARLVRGERGAEGGLGWAAGLPVGSEAPEFELAGLHGERLTLESLRARGRPVMLLFTDPKCGPCNSLLPEIGRWQADEQWLTIVPVSRGNPEDSRSKAREHGIHDLLLQEDREVSIAYEAHATPAAVLVSEDGQIASPVGAGVDRIRELVQHASGQRLELVRRSGQNGAQAPAPAAPAQAPPPANEDRIGQPAPAVELPDLDGKTVTLADFSGTETLVLFWNPGCGFCQQMLPDLRSWEADRPEGTPDILVISTGDPAANREMELASTLVLDEKFAAGGTFGAGGTPMAVLVDAEGKIASGVAAGADAVFELARSVRTG